MVRFQNVAYLAGHRVACPTFSIHRPPTSRFQSSSVSGFRVRHNREEAWSEGSQLISADVYRAESVARSRIGDGDGGHDAIFDRGISGGGSDPPDRLPSRRLYR